MTPPPFRRAEDRKKSSPPSSSSPEEQVMADFPRPGFDHPPPPWIEELKPSEAAMGLAHQEPNPFVALDIGSLSLLAIAAPDKEPAPSPRLALQKTLSRKGSQRGGVERKAAEGDVAAAAGGAGTGEKSPLLIHVAGDGEPVGQIGTATPTAAGGGRGRRLGGRRSSPWLDPRRVVVFFATVSSMGTLILLYFTLSMGKIANSDADAR